MLTKSSHRHCRTLTLVVSVCCLLFFSGCDDPSVGYVAGVVTLDGVPVKAAKVAFNPSKGRGSAGVTDDQGRYELRYLADQKGALIGNHKVIVSTETYGKEGKMTADGEIGEAFSGGIKPHPETIPSQFSDYRKTVLTAEVKAGQNECDFELTTQE